MKASKPMLKTMQNMVDNFENLCQIEYTKIDHAQHEIELSQLKLEKLETQYTQAKDILDFLKGKKIPFKTK